jgi:predicted Fe-Mo cluster-binding NifX family protein
MKVIVPVVDNEDARFEVAKGLHNAEFFCLYDCVDKTYEWINIEKLSNQVGNLSLVLKHKGIFTVICTHMPIIALGIFIESGLKVYQANGYDLVENISLLQNKQLKPLTAVSILALEACSTGACGLCKSPCN